MKTLNVQSDTVVGVIYLGLFSMSKHYNENFVQLDTVVRFFAYVKTLYWECSVRYSTVSYLTFPLGQILMSKHYNGNVQLDTVVTVNEDKNSESVNLIRCSVRSHVIL